MNILRRLVLISIAFMTLSYVSCQDDQNNNTKTSNNNPPPPPPRGSDPKYIYYTNPYGGSIERTNGSTSNLVAAPGGFTSGIALSGTEILIGNQSKQILAKFSSAGSSDGTFGSSGRTYTGLCIGPDNNLYASQNDGSSSKGIIERYDATTGDALGSTFATETTPAAYTSVNTASYIEGITFGPDGNLYCASKHTGSIIIYQGPSGETPGTFVAELEGVAEASGVAFGPDGKLYVTQLNKNLIAKYNGTAFEIFIDDPHLNAPQGITFGKDGYVYVANIAFGNGGNIARYEGPSGDNPGKFVDIYFMLPSGGANYLVMADQ
jgi:WD40 repeat protein